MSRNIVLRLWHFVLMVLNNVYSVPAYLLWTTLLKPLIYVNPNWYHALEGVLYSGLLHFISFWVWRQGFTVSEVGDDISCCIDSECLLLVNHQSTGDVLTLTQVLTGSSKRRLSQHVCWILDDMFRYTHFGFVCHVHGDMFILQGRHTRNSELSRLSEHLRNVYVKQDRTWIILFPEGGFLCNRRETSQEYGRKNGFPHLEHCTLPRVGAVHTILNTLSAKDCNKLVAESHHRTSKNNNTGKGIAKNLKYIIDVTIGYPKGEPFSLGDVVFGFLDNYHTTVHYRVFPTSSIPHDEELLLQWLYSRYAEKDALLDQFYRTGSFTSHVVKSGVHDKQITTNGELQVERTLQWNSFWCWMIYGFYILSTFLFGYCAFRFIVVTISPALSFIYSLFF